MIQIESSDCNLSDRRSGNQLVAVPLKMVRPIIIARIEKRNDFTRSWVGSFGSIRLSEIATRTRPCQIRQRGLTASRLRNHMLDVKRRSLQRLVHAAILAAIVGTQSDLRLKTGRSHAGRRPSRRSASARISDNDSLISTSDSNSSRSVSESCPSLFRSISSCIRRSVRSGSLSWLTDSTHSGEAEIVLIIYPRTSDSISSR